MQESLADAIISYRHMPYVPISCHL